MIKYFFGFLVTIVVLTEQTNTSFPRAKKGIESVDFCLFDASAGKTMTCALSEEISNVNLISRFANLKCYVG